MATRRGISVPYPKQLEEFYRKYIRDIGESLDDFYHDYIYWKNHKTKMGTTDEEAFPQYAEIRLQKWERIAKQEGYQFTR